MNQEAMFTQLDQAEEKLLTRWEAWIGTAFRSIPWQEIDRMAKPGARPRVLSRLPPLLTADAGTLAGVLAEHGAEMVAAGMAHGDLMVEDLHRRYRGRKLSDPIFDSLPELRQVDLRSLAPEPESENSEGVYSTRKLAELPGFDYEYGEDPRVIPERAIAAMEARAMVLAGDVEADMLAQVKKALVRYLAGSSRKATEEALEDLLKSNRERASLITTTESTYSYNRGRLASFAENAVDYVQFSAVNDSRTSPICRSRHGLIMRMDDPRVSGNTPPLHGRCRSVLVPVYSRYQGSLITEERLDWSGTAPLPKGWKSAA